MPSDPARWDLRLVVEHFALLMARREAILAWAPWRDIEVVGCRASLAYLGGGRFALGPLLRAWADGRLTTARDGRPLYVHEVSGSVLSGRGGAYAFDPATGEVVRAGGLRDWVARADPRALAAGGESSWSLGQLLAAWGRDVPDVALRDDRRVLGRYVHAAATLYDADDRAVARFDFPSPTDALPVEQTWRPVTDAAVTATRLGVTRHGASPREVAFDGPLPPNVAAAAAAWLRRAGLL